ncbi:DoxX family membrane protein [Tengunoibacter tsumagoiensis]|uniref:DoxX family protein n=1 Tax=Tengunoibacter tsumagoiensis TaxID=2014871 RepID=A0A402AAN1_9CHLR|nr:DoxX family membrane protein [Tengunoibacter tsumagoiensis]GCE16158.1 hypothetical protein KTT_60170 [Tengunoibacter tsumagoiensis]
MRTIQSYEGTPSQSWLRAGHSSYQKSQQVLRRQQTVAALRILFGVLWAWDAWQKWQSPFVAHVARYLTEEAYYASPFFRSWLTFWGSIGRAQPSGFAYSLAIGEACIAFGLMSGTLTNLTCCTGILFTLAGWSTLNLFGGLIGNSGNDPGIILVYLLALLGLLVSNAGKTWGTDRYLHGLLGQWNFLASHAKLPFQISTPADQTVSNRLPQRLR